MRLTCSSCEEVYAGECECWPRGGRGGIYVRKLAGVPHCPRVQLS